MPADKERRPRESLLDKINSTLTDAPMPNALGRFANAYRRHRITLPTDHSLLWAPAPGHPDLAICIVCSPSSFAPPLPHEPRQAHNGLVMQAKMAKLHRN